GLWRKAILDQARGRTREARRSAQRPVAGEEAKNPFGDQDYFGTMASIPAGSPLGHCWRGQPDEVVGEGGVPTWAHEHSYAIWGDDNPRDEQGRVDKAPDAADRHCRCYRRDCPPGWFRTRGSGLPARAAAQRSARDAALATGKPCEPAADRGLQSFALAVRC